MIHLLILLLLLALLPRPILQGCGCLLLLAMIAVFLLIATAHAGWMGSHQAREKLIDAFQGPNKCCDNVAWNCGVYPIHGE
jgi:hypothetical protein